MFAGLEGGHGEREVSVDRRGDGHSVNFRVLQHLLEISRCFGRRETTRDDLQNFWI